MLSLLSEIRFWSLQDDIVIKTNDYTAYKYVASSSKKEHDNLHLQAKQKYAEQRGLHYVLPNKRPAKLRDKLRELEDNFIQSKLIAYSWNIDTLQLLLSRGLIVYIKLSTNRSDLAGIGFDRTLSLKLSESINDGAFVGKQLICITKEGKVYGHGGLKDWCIESGSRKNLSVFGEYMVVYGRTGNEQPQPWSPLSRDHQRANLHMYFVGVRGPELVAYKKTDGEPIKIYVSTVEPRTIIIIEQKVSQRGSVSIEVSSFELCGTMLKRVNVTSVPLQTQVSCVELSKQENFLVMGCIDASIALLDRVRGLSKIVKAAFIPMHISWHESEVLIGVANEKGQLQYYDSALACLNTCSSDELIANILFDLSSYYHSQKLVANIFWKQNNLFVVFDQGPIVVIHHLSNLSFTNLVQLYLQTQKVERAINLLLSTDFTEDSYRVLQKIVNYIMREPLTETTAKYLQDALGSFHCPKAPISAKIHHRYGSQVKSLTRRFFHQLVRAKMFETAFLLAVDLGHHDLFMDLHYVAVTIGETEMAAAARAQASALLSRCSSEASNCSRSSCSQCSDSITETSDDEDELIDEEQLSDQQQQQQQQQQSSHASNENYLSTNFNQPIPKTYKPITVPPPIPVIDLPKIKLLPKPSNNPPPLLIPPPLPTVTTIPTLGIPYIPTPPIRYTFENRFVPIRQMYPSPPKIRLPPQLRQPPPIRVPPPPLPVTSATNIVATQHQQQQPKKVQAKVKFSDTVTAFIVPEVRRPNKVNPPIPPPHVTDPQRELADSLPLCHPNEDYLKDFTPIRRDVDDTLPTNADATDNNNTPSTSSGSNTNSSAPKIKVVHFGLV